MASRGWLSTDARRNAPTARKHELRDVMAIDTSCYWDRRAVVDVSSIPAWAAAWRFFLRSLVFGGDDRRYLAFAPMRHVRQLAGMTSAHTDRKRKNQPDNPHCAHEQHVGSDLLVTVQMLVHLTGKIEAAAHSPASRLILQ